MLRKMAVLFVLGAALVCGQPAWGAEFGMGIESATQKQGVITVVTTGARFEIDRRGTIHCWQRIPRVRHVLDVRFAQAVGPFRIEKKDGFSCTLSCPRAELTIHGDSLVIMKLKENLKTRFTGLFTPAYHFEKGGKWILIDQEGGFGVYPVAKKTTSTPAFSKLPWNIAYDFTKGDEAWLSVFPPRPYNWNRAFEAIEHDSYSRAEPFPTNAQIVDASKYCKVLTLHANIWRDIPESAKKKLSQIPRYKRYIHGPMPFASPNPVPMNMKEFNRVRDEAHKHGMKVVVYVSPYYSTAPDIYAEMRRVLDEYKLDGLYFDGISMDFRKSYAIIRRAREILGNNRILYVHCSSDPLGDGRIYCPFIDTYADYILRGEPGVWGLKLQPFLRWTISGYHISNSVGYWCYYGSNRQQGYNASAPRRGTYVDTVPTVAHIDAAIRNHAFIWRQGQEWSEKPQFKDSLQRFDKVYYGDLAKLREEVEKRKAAGK